MTELWIPITIAAALLQCIRTALQKHLKASLSTNGATFVRFFYGFPIAILYVSALHYGAGLSLPSPNMSFAFYCLLGGVAQIVGTSLLIQVFSFRNFAVGTTFSKTEAMQTAVFGIVILGEPLSLGAFVAILISMVGVMAISLARSDTGPRRFLLAWTDKAALIGIASGSLFGVSAVAIRAAALSLGGDGFLIQAAFTLVCITVLQTLLMACYLWLREREQLRKVLVTWRFSALVGIAGVVGSAGWFTAMTIQNAAYVRTLGQIELVFTMIASYYFFKERSTYSELFGIALIIAGIVILLNFH